MKFEKFTLLRMRMYNVHGNNHGDLAVPPPRAYVYCQVWGGCSSPMTVSPDSEATHLLSVKSVSGVVVERDLTVGLYTKTRACDIRIKRSDSYWLICCYCLEYSELHACRAGPRSKK